MMVAIRRTFLLLLLNTVIVITSSAQLYEHLCDDDYVIDTTETKALTLKIDALTFFRDNEYNSSLVKGYSLPGLCLNPKVMYNPMENIHMELGFNALIFEGANKYPNYAYHDIGTWKGNQYQSGAHLVPWFRAQVNTDHTCLVLGNIYGGSNHLLDETMFNPEQNLTADPEMGFQALIDYKYWHFDTWINWQSYIFEEDSHQEAFTVGVSSQIRWNDKNSKFHFYTPINILAQHRGGEQDTTSLGVQTLVNGSAGISMRYNFINKVINSVDANLSVLGCYQESGNLWSKSSGAAFHFGTSVSLWNTLSVKAGAFRIPNYYVNMFGSPLFSSYSIKTNTDIPDGMSTYYIRLDYSRKYSDKYTLGANVDLFNNKSNNLNETNCSFGVYLRLTPSFLIKKWM